MEPHSFTSLSAFGVASILDSGHSHKCVVVHGMLAAFICVSLRAIRSKGGCLLLVYILW